MKSTIRLLSTTVLVSIVTTLSTPTTASAAAGIGPSFKGPIGLQLYSLREQFAHDVPGTLDKVRAFGFKYVELAGTYGDTPEQFRAALKDHGLKPISGHFPFETYRDHVEDVIRDAKALGLKYAGCAWIPHQDPFDEKTCREAIAVFNRAARPWPGTGCGSSTTCTATSFNLTATGPCWTS